MENKEKHRLDKIICNARDICKLSKFTKQGKVHFRPTSTGITMVGLLKNCPQLGKGGYKADDLLQKFDVEFKEHCIKKLGRPTPEKVLQSFLISSAYQNERRITFPQSDDGGISISDLYFVTDELALYTENNKKVVCDILALRRFQNGAVPVLIELKSKREMTRLCEQLEYSELMQRHYEQLEQLFSALLEDDVRFTGKPEKWIIWPALENNETDKRESELLKEGIRLISYKTKFDFHVGAQIKEN